MTLPGPEKNFYFHYGYKDAHELHMVHLNGFIYAKWFNRPDTWAKQDLTLNQISILRVQEIKDIPVDILAELVADALTN